MTWAGCAAGLDTITFDNTGGDIGGRGPIVEGGFEFEAKGESWMVLSGLRPEGSVLLTFWGIPPAVGNLITFKRLDESPFLFRSVDVWGRRDGQRNDVVMARGFLQGREIASQMLQTSNEVWSVELAGPAFATPIDLLQLELVESNDNGLGLDNLAFESVPEPTVGALLVTGVAAFGWVRGRRCRINPDRALTRPGKGAQLCTIIPRNRRDESQEP